MNIKRKSKFLALILIGAGIISNNTATVVSATSDDKAPANEFSENYLILKGENTGQAWIRNEFNRNFDRWRNHSLTNYAVDKENGKNVTVKDKLEKEKIARRNPIIFFNVNPKYNVSNILEIGFALTYKDSGDNVYLAKTFDFDIWYNDVGYPTITDVEFGKNTALNSVKSSDVHTMHFTEGKYHLPMNREVNVTEYDFSPEGSVSKKTYTDKKDTQKINEFIFNLPSIGSTEILREFYEIAGNTNKFGDSILDSSIFPYYYTDDNGAYTTYDKLRNDKLRGKDYGYYLILPIGATSEYEITYLKAKLILDDGTIIDPDIPFEEIPELPETQRAIRISKKDGEWLTGNAVYFPGDRYYKAKSVLLESATLKEDATSVVPVIVSTGAIHGKFYIEYSQLRQNTKLILGETINLAYEFQSRANGLIVDIPSIYQDAEVIFVFEINPYNYDTIVDEPSYINLRDENGDLGIGGKLPEDSDPNKKTLWEKIKEKLNDLFGSNGSLAGLGAFLKVIGALIGVLLIAWVVIKIYNFIKGFKIEK